MEIIRLFIFQRKYVYETLYFIQILAQAQIGQVFGNGSGVYVVLITLICGQYDLLFCSLKNLLYTAEINSGVSVKILRSSICQILFISLEKIRLNLALPKV